MDSSSVYTGIRQSLEPAYPLRNQEADTFSPTAAIPQELQTQYATRDQQAFNQFSLETVEICAARMREALANKTDLRQLYFSLNEFLGQRRRELAQESPIAHMFGELREKSNQDHFHTGFGHGSPYPEEGYRIAQLLSKQLESQGEDKREATTFKVQVITPPIFQRIMGELGTKILAQTPLEEADKIQVDLLDMCTAYVSHDLLDRGLGVVKDGIVHCNLEQMKKIRNGKDFIVGQVLFHPKKNETIPLTAFITGGSQKEGRTVLDKERPRIIVLHPPLSALKRLHEVLADQFVEILQWDGKNRDVLKAWIARFIYVYAPAMPYLRGTDWALQVVTKAFYKQFGFVLVKYAPGVQVGLKAQETHHLQDFVDRYVTYHAEDPTGRRLPP